MGLERATGDLLLTMAQQIARSPISNATLNDAINHLSERHADCSDLLFGMVQQGVIDVSLLDFQSELEERFNVIRGALAERN